MAANGFQQLKQIIDQTRVVRPPRHRLSTFGVSEIQYNIISTLSLLPAQSHLRTGRVTAERPQILTPELFSQQFKGFGPESDDFERLLKENFQDAFRGLEYTFNNHLESTTAHSLDARELAQNIKKDLDQRDVARAAVMFGPEKGWQFSLMKFILDETLQSFPINVRELEERGLFDPAQADLHRKRREIESLFQRASFRPELIQTLGQKLKEYRLFEDYQDRFFQLVKSTGHRG
jgi:hypothetical protein